MSLLSDIFSGVAEVGKSIYNSVSGGGIGSTLLKTVLSGYALNKVNDSIKKDNSSAGRTNGSTATSTVDPGVRLQVPAGQDQKIPIVYGQAHLGGIITEAVMDQSNTRMTFVVTICEKTGIKLSDSAQSSFSFQDIFYNDQRMVFSSSGSNAGVLAESSVDRSGNIDSSISGLVKVYCYNGDSESPVAPVGYTNGSLPNAYDVVPNWTSSHMMNDLIFAVVQVTYSKEKGVTGLPTMRFLVSNSMTLPGDCLLDYMTNTRYGAGIPEGEIYTS